MIKSLKRSLRIKKRHRPKLDSAVSEDGEATEQELVIETQDKSLTGKVTDLGYGGKAALCVCGFKKKCSDADGVRRDSNWWLWSGMDTWLFHGAQSATAYSQHDPRHNQVSSCCHSTSSLCRLSWAGCGPVCKTWSIIFSALLADIYPKH
jgi:hypothetical protein